MTAPAPVSRRSPPFVTCFPPVYQVKPVLETMGTGGAPVSGIFREGFPLLDPLLAGKPILETIGGRNPGFRDDRAPFSRFLSVKKWKPILRTDACR